MIKIAKIKSSWLRALAAEEVEIPIKQKMRRFPLELLDKMELRNARLVPKIAISLLEVLGNLTSSDKSSLRLILTRLLPVDPLYKLRQTPIDLYILTHPKDIDILPTSLFAAHTSVKNNLQCIFVVGPSEMGVEVMEIIRNLGLNASFISDEELLTDFLGERWITIPSVPRMEILKILCGLTSQIRTSLVLDGDTVLLRDRIWSSDSKTILIVAQEYLTRHINFNKEVLVNSGQKGLGFVAHHQVLVADELEMMLKECNGIVELASKIDKSYKNYTEDNNTFPSEWQLIGDSRIRFNPKSVSYAKFSNYGISRHATKWKFASSDTLEIVASRVLEIKIACPGLFSLSLHNYK